MEFWVVDDRGRLCDGRDLVDAHERIDPEFVGPLLEVRTEPCETEYALRRDLQETLRAALRRADRVGKRLVPLGTPLTRADPPATGERGRLFEEIYGDGIESAKNCAGTHVHFERGNVRRQLTLLTALDPALALLSSSPYYCGRREMDSSRAHAYRTECGADFEEYCGLWSYPESVAEWERRVEDAFERFESLAADRGVPSETVREHFVAEDAVLNPVRLRECQPTVEWRAPDSTLPSQVVRLATDVGRLVEQTDSKRIELADPGREGVAADCLRVPDFGDLRDVSGEAIRWGLDAGRVRGYLDRFGFDVADYRPISGQLQGPGRLRESEARKIRLEYAERLRADVASLTAVPFDEPVERCREQYVFA